MPAGTFIAILIAGLDPVVLSTLLGHTPPSLSIRSPSIYNVPSMPAPRISRIPLAAKLIGITALLLTVMCSVAIYSYFRILKVRDEVEDLANNLEPLTHAFAGISADLAQQEIHRERLLEFSGIGVDKNRAGEELLRFQESGKVVDQAISAGKILIAQSLKRAKVEADRLEIARLEPMLLYLGKEHRRLNDDFLKVLRRRESGQAAEAVALLEVVREAEDRLNQQAAEIETEIERFSEKFASEVRGDEWSAVRMAGENLWVTIGTGLLGLLLGVIFTAGLVRPVRKLMAGAQAVEGGNLDIEVPVTSRDEIGMLSHSFNKMVHELKVKERIKETFGKYIDPRVVEELIQQPDLAGERRVITVSFCDLAGFTAISELLTADAMVRLINYYFTLVSEPVARNSGVVDKYIGDAMMAFWCPPFTSEQDHARLGCLACLEQFDRMADFRRALPELIGIKRGLPALNMRAGVCTGTAIVGNIGSNVSRSYTVMGETVNIASRLESANKQYGTRILISEETERLASEAVESREIDFVRVVGKTEPVRIFELLARKGELEPRRQQLRTLFSPALQAYRDRQWDAAESQFRQCLLVDPEDGPSKLFLERVDHFRDHPPVEMWDGVWTLAHK